LNFVTEKIEAIRKISELFVFVGSATEKVDNRHDEPKTLDTLGGADLILIEGQNVFDLAEVDLNLPS
jgi:hypothetical protein